MSSDLGFVLIAVAMGVLAIVGYVIADDIACRRIQSKLREEQAAYRSKMQAKEINGK